MRYHMIETKEEQKVEIKNSLGQIISRGDIILSFGPWRTRILVVMETIPVMDRWVKTKDTIDERRTKIRGIEIHGYIPQRWDAPTQQYVNIKPYEVQVYKSRASNLHTMLKVTLDDLGRFGVKPEEVRATYETVGKVLNGEYDKKTKKKK